MTESTRRNFHNYIPYMRLFQKYRNNWKEISSERKRLALNEELERVNLDVREKEVGSFHEVKRIALLSLHTNFKFKQNSITFTRKI